MQLTSLLYIYLDSSSSCTPCELMCESYSPDSRRLGSDLGARGKWLVVRGWPGLDPTGTRNPNPWAGYESGSRPERFRGPGMDLANIDPINWSLNWLDWCYTKTSKLWSRELQRLKVRVYCTDLNMCSSDTVLKFLQLKLQTLRELYLFRSFDVIYKFCLIKKKHKSCETHV